MWVRFPLRAQTTTLVMNNFTYFFWYRWNYIWKYRIRIIKAAFKWQPHSYIYTVDLFTEALHQQANHFGDMGKHDSIESEDLLRSEKNINKVASLLECTYQDKFLDQYWERYPMPDFQRDYNLFTQWINNKEKIPEQEEYFIDCYNKQQKAEQLVWRLISNHITSWID